MASTIQTLQDTIRKLKKEKNIAIAAHSYQATEILEIADLTGDSYKLSVDIQKLEAPTILLCGVRFMAETVKMLSPLKKVILPVAQATCPMAEQISPARVLDFKRKNPSFKVVAYVNTTAQLKAVCDVCVTSSSALEIVRAMPDKDILFIPDQNLGSYIKENCPDKNILLWDGCCPVHHQITAEDCRLAKNAHPHAKLLMHPEIPKDALAYADLIGSTAAILDYAKQTDQDCIIGTEKAVADYLSTICPDRHFWLLSKKLICPDMRLTTLADVCHALLGTGGEEITLEENLRLQAKHCIDEMIRLSTH